MNKEKLAELAHKYLNGTATEQEKQLLNEWYDAVENEMEQDPSKSFFITSEETETRVLDQLMNGVNADLQSAPSGSNKSLAVKMFPLKTTMKWVAAASVLVLLSFGSLYFLRSNPSQHHSASIVKHETARPQIIPPGGDKATLVLPSGEVVVLEDVANGSIKNTSGLEISKQNGQLIFRAPAQKLSDPEIFNTVYTPRGGQYRVLLPDGSKVWLNAASSLKFPGVFSGKTRDVELTGEGYFEIAKNAAMPFRVRANTMQVEVLGTHFNINCYPDEAAMNTTLLEGSVKIVDKGNSGMLKPGQQASIKKDAGKMKITAVDVDQAVAWKNGLFQFDGVTVESVMKQLARWYNIDVDYKVNAGSGAHFRGLISRSVDLSKVVKMLELTGELHFKIEDKKVTVMP